MIRSLVIGQGGDTGSIAGKSFLAVAEERGKMATRETSELAHIALEVDDMEKTVRELEAKGVVFDVQPIDCGTCTVAFFTDPRRKYTGVL